MKTELPTLYKKNSRGKNQVWKIWVEDGPPNPRYYTTFGQEDGKFQETFVDVKNGKNIGKSNETTPYEQALSEAESLWKKQKDKGYDENSTAGLQGKPTLIRPMLAHSYDKHPAKILFPCYAQPKLDGVRALFIDGQLMSRKGKYFTSVPHIIKEAEKVIQSCPGLILDGELYNHTDDFEELISFIRREDSSTETEAIEYHVYDCFYPDNRLSFEDRYAILQDISDTYFGGFLKLVDTRTINAADSIDDYHNDMVEIGYEGIMLRNSAAKYKIDKRSYDLQKVKAFQTAEFEIVGAEQNKGRQSNQCTVLCQTKEKAIFGVKPKGNEKIREEYWVNKDKNVGKLLTVQFFEWTNSDPAVPRFPIGLSVRDYE